MGRMLPEGITPPVKSRKLGITQYSTLIMSDTDPDDQYRKANGTDKGVFIANCLNVIIPESSPEGTCTLFFTTFGDSKEWATLSPKDYYKKKEERMKDRVDYYEKTTGITIRPYIEEITFASPATFCRYLNTLFLEPYHKHVHVSLEKMYEKVMSSSRGKRSSG